MSIHSHAMGREFPDRFAPVGKAARLVIADCIRKWAEGAALTEIERRVVDDALTYNRLDMIQILFRDEEAGHVG